MAPWTFILDLLLFFIKKIFFECSVFLCKFSLIPSVMLLVGKSRVGDQ